MKRVSFEVAQTIKEAGYPQVYGPFYDSDGDLWENPDEAYYFDHVYYAPTYYEVWRWLWKEKGIQIPVGVYSATIWKPEVDGNMHNYGAFTFNDDPEEAIEQAIKYLVENNLIK